ncbi:MAG: imelysin family protein, partial [Rhodobacterales bacterium]
MTRLFLASLATTALTACPALAVEKSEVIGTYADIAAAKYADSLTTAQALDAAIKALIATPSEQTMADARTAWIDARIPYMQTEVYRFGNPIVDDWEGKVNAWPMDEGLIDYVDAAYGGATDENAYAALQEADAVEANVATGYHAIEFLLWGQDLNGTDAGAGTRSWTDYAAGDDCTNANCDRRGDYLNAASDLLLSDLEWMVAQWAPEGDARTALTSDENAGLTAILTGMGSLSYGELAGQRMKLGVLLNDPEEEHDCFSDNTQWSHYYDALGI